MAANQGMLMQILDMGLGFDIPDIQEALINTGNSSTEMAVNYLFMKASGGGGTGNPPSASSGAAASASSSSAKKNESNSSGGISGVPKSSGGPKPRQNSQKQPRKTKEDIALERQMADLVSKLRSELNAMHISVKDDDTLRLSLKRNENDVKRALQDIVKSKESHVINSASDADAMKADLIKKAEMRRKEQMNDDRELAEKMKRERDEWERKEREKEFKKREAEKRLAERRRITASKKNDQKRQRKERLLKWHDRQEKYDQYDQSVLSHAKAKRDNEEKKIIGDSPQKAIDTLFSRYGDDFARNSLELIHKILTKILKNPSNMKYRRINLQNRKIHNLIETPLGAMRLLTLIGFEREEKSLNVHSDEKEIHLVLSDDLMRKPSTGKGIEACIEMIDKRLKANETQTKEIILNKICKEVDSKDYGDDFPKIYGNLYLSTHRLSQIFTNITISPLSEHLRVININDLSFKPFIGTPWKGQLVKILKLSGFKLHKDDRMNTRVLRMVWANASEQERILRDLKSYIRDLNDCKKVLLNKTDLFNVIKKVKEINLANNNGKELRSFLKMMDKAIQKIIDEPLEMKYQRISIHKLRNKYTAMKAMVSVIKLFGFRKDKGQKETKEDDTTYLFVSSDFKWLEMRHEMYRHVMAQ